MLPLLPSPVILFLIVWTISPRDSSVALSLLLQQQQGTIVAVYPRRPLQRNMLPHRTNDKLSR